MDKYHAFYRYAYGNVQKHLEFYDLCDALLLRTSADVEENGIRELVIIYGEALEFEPCEVVKSYRLRKAGL